MSGRNVSGQDLARSPWRLLAQKTWIVPIPGTTKMAHMIENIGAPSIELTSSEIGELTAAVSAIEIEGARLPDAVQVYSDMEAPART